MFPCRMQVYFLVIVFVVFKCLIPSKCSTYPHNNTTSECAQKNRNEDVGEERNDGYGSAKKEEHFGNLASEDDVFLEPPLQFLEDANINRDNNAYDGKDFQDENDDETFNDANDDGTFHDEDSNDVSHDEASYDEDDEDDFFDGNDDDVHYDDEYHDETNGTFNNIPFLVPHIMEEPFETGKMNGDPFLPWGPMYDSEDVYPREEEREQTTVSNKTLQGNSTDRNCGECVKPRLIKDEISELTDSHIADKVWRIGAPIILASGTVGNVLSILLMRRNKVKQSTTSLYFIVLACADSLVLYNGLLHLYLDYVFDFNWRLQSSLACKLHMFFSYVLLQYDAWVLVAVTLERLCAVVLPHKCRLFFSKRNATVALLIQALVLASINCHVFWTVNIRDVVFADGSSDQVCGPTSKAHWHFIHVTWPWFDFLLGSLLPFLVIFASNMLIVTRLAHAEYVRRVTLNVVEPANPNSSGNNASASSSSSSSSASSRPKLSSMTAVLLTVSLVFLLTTAPCSVYVISQVLQYRGAGLEKRARLSLVWACLNLLLYTNNAINFLLYLISGPRFRREFLKMICKKTNTIQPVL